MKKLYFSFLTLVLASAAYSQHSITVANTNAVGDIYNYYPVDTVGVQPGGSGAGQTWTFSTYTISPTMASMQYVAPSTTTLSASFPTSTVAENDNSNYTFFTMNGTTSYQTDGMELTVSGLNGKIVYSDPGLIYNAFPYGYPSSTPSDAITGTISGSFAGTATGSVTTTCDGSGSLVLASGTYGNVIRITRILTMNLNVTSPLSTTGTYYEHRYEYYSPLSKSPLFAIKLTHLNTTVGGTTDQKFVFINSVVNVGMEEHNSNLSLNVFPVPASNELNLNLSLKKKSTVGIELVNQLGQVVKTENMMNQDAGAVTKKIDIAGMSSGVYYMRVHTEEFTEIKKIIVE